MDTARPATLDDVEALGRLHRRVDVAWWGREETDDGEIRHLFGWVGDLDARSRVLERDGELTALACVAGAGDATLLVSPALGTGDRADATDTLLAWLATAGAEEVDSPRQDAERIAALQRNGWAALRSAFALERPAHAAPSGQVAAPTWPDGVTVRGFDPDRDAQEVHRLVYSVWTDVPGHHDRPLEEWRHLFLGFGGFDPALQVLAVRNGRAVGVALCRTYKGTDGWVSQLAVAREARGIGLGRAALLEALRRLAATKGVEIVGLSVQAENAAALRLYRSVGLEVTRELVVHQRRVEVDGDRGIEARG